MKTTIDMAREAGCAVPSIDGKSWCVSPSIEKLVSLVRADEREACAKVADEHMRECEGKSFGVGAAIRARGNT